MPTENDDYKNYFELTYTPDGDGPSGYLVKDAALKGGYAVPAGLFYYNPPEPSSERTEGNEGLIKGGDIDYLGDFLPNESLVLPDYMLDYFIDYGIIDDLTKGKKENKRNVMSNEESKSSSVTKKNRKSSAKTTRKTKKHV
jgi:hypothetical protein